MDMLAPTDTADPRRADVDDAVTATEGSDADITPVTMVTTEDASRLAGVSVRTVRRWIQHGHLPAADGVSGKLVSPADLGEARRRAGHGRGQGHQATGQGQGHGHGVPPARTDAATGADTGRVVAGVPPSARDQLAAVWDEWLAPLTARIEALARENGELRTERDVAMAERDRLRTERATDRALADQLVNVLEREQAAAVRRAEAAEARLNRLTAGDTLPDPSTASPGAPDVAEPSRPAADALMLRWRRWWRRMTDG